MKINVLDHGYVELIGKMLAESEDKDCAQSLDEMVVESARVSYGSGLKGAEKDKKLLHYLIEHEHGTPLEAAVFKFEVKCPIFVQRQWRTHRWGSFNEISGRYTDQISEEYYVPEKFRMQDTKNKQGSTNTNIGEQKIGGKNHPELPNGGWTVRERYVEEMESQKNTYQILLDEGVAKELARGILGTAFYTKFVWVVNARSLMNFLILRCEGHAQYEIRMYGWIILNIFKERMPWTYEALLRYFPSSFKDEPK